MTSPQPAAATRRGRLLVAVAIVALAFNLRPAAVSVGPVLDEVTTSLAMSPTVAGLLTTLPVLAFAAFGALTPAAAARLGRHRLTLLALVAITTGLLLRPWADSAVLFLALSLLSLAGMATANVLLPSLVRQHFPHRVGWMTSLYTTSLAVGLTLASMLTVPLAAAVGDGDWRYGLVTWAATALLATLPWLGLARYDRTGRRGSGHTWGLGDVARTRLGWAMALLFGLQSLQAYSVFGWFAQVYRDAGFSASTAGLLLGVITGVSIPASFVIPALAARLGDPRVLLVGLVVCYPVGYLGLVVAPREGAVVWAVAVGLAASTFPLVLALIGLRARTPAGTAALSGFTQSTGYLIAALGPFGIGALYGATGGWTVPLLVLTALSVPQLVAGLYAARPASVEAELGGGTHGATPR